MVEFEIAFRDLDPITAVGDGVYMDEHGNLHIKTHAGKKTVISCNVREWVYVRAFKEVEDVHQE